MGVSEVTVRLFRGQIVPKMQANSLAEFIRNADGITA